MRYTLSIRLVPEAQQKLEDIKKLTSLSMNEIVNQLIIGFDTEDMESTVQQIHAKITELKNLQNELNATMLINKKKLTEKD